MKPITMFYNTLSALVTPYEVFIRAYQLGDFSIPLMRVAINRITGNVVAFTYSFLKPIALLRLRIGHNVCGIKGNY